MHWLERNASLRRPRAGGLGGASPPKTASLFQDNDPSHRIFILRNVQKCVSSRGLHCGFVFAWTTVAPRDPDYTTEFSMHETVHNWPRLGHSGHRRYSIAMQVHPDLVVNIEPIAQVAIA